MERLAAGRFVLIHRLFQLKRAQQRSYHYKETAFGYSNVQPVTTNQTLGNHFLKVP